MPKRIPPLYTHEELRAMGEANDVPNWDTLNLRTLVNRLWDLEILTQAILDARQAVLLAQVMAEDDE